MLAAGIDVSETSLPSALAQIDYITGCGVRCPEVEISDILAIICLDPFLLAGLRLDYSEQSYVRHHIHSGKNYSVLAIAWLPRQGSPVHSHKTWCAFSVYQGHLTESLYSQDSIGVDLISEKHLFPGHVSHSPRDRPVAHRLKNNSTRPALSLHVYGVPFDRLGTGVNYIWNEA